MADAMEALDRLEMEMGCWLVSEMKSDPEATKAMECGYRRGFVHGVHAFADVIAKKNTHAYDAAIELAMSMRYDGERHPAYVQEFLREYKRARGRR